MIEQKITALARLGKELHPQNSALHAVVLEAGKFNPWFTPKQVYTALQNIRETMLDPARLRSWVNTYSLSSVSMTPKKVGLVMAGNIPLVGFHDFLCVWLSGHLPLIKCSDKDAHLLPFLLNQLITIDQEFQGDWKWVDRLADFDAVIATGSDNSARYFHAYFGAYPNIIRKNRNGVAILTGQENTEQLQALTRDMLTFFGLGCRNVSKLVVPEGYDFEPLLTLLEDYPELNEHNRYRNNFDYQFALCIMNQEKHFTKGQVLFRAHPGLLSPMATIHYEEFTNLEHARSILERDLDQIQCILGEVDLPGMDLLPLGSSQCPGLTDYADGVDIMAFLTQLHGHAKN